MPQPVSPILPQAPITVTARCLVLTLLLSQLQACQSLQAQLQRAAGGSQAATPTAAALSPPAAPRKDDTTRINPEESAAAGAAGTDAKPGAAVEGAGGANRRAANDHAMVQRWLVQAIDALQNGAEHDAESLLDQVQQNEPGNSLARKLRDQIHVDPQRALGAAHFPYTVQTGDTLGTLSRRFLNDPYRFYLLARYNGLRIPARLTVGQVIQIPGRDADTPVPLSSVGVAPGNPSAGPAARSAAPAVAGMQSPTPVQPSPLAGPLQAQRAAAPSGVTPPAPSLSDQALQIARNSREAELCQRQQDLDCALRKWEEVLKLDPGNPNALAKRERIAVLRSKLGTVDTGK